MNVKERLKEYLKSQKIQFSTFEESLKVSNGYINSISKNLGIDKLNLIIENYSNLNIEWLLSGNGNMLKDRYTESANSMVQEPQAVYKMRTDDLITDTQAIPLFDDYEAIAGLTPVYLNQSDKKPNSYISIPNLPKCDGAIPITVDSMYPLLKSGDIVMFKKIENIKDGIFYGEMYLVSLMVDNEEYITVKFIQKSEKGDNYVKLVSQNTHHQPKDVHLKKIKALALVKASIRINSMH